MSSSREAEREADVRSWARRWRLRWSANEAYFPWLLSRVPRSAATALDVGCGLGELAVRLSVRGMEVDALDVDAAIVARARARHAGAPVRWLVGDAFGEVAELRPGGYDVVAAVASLHQEPFRSVLDALVPRVRPGGQLLVVGLFRAASWRDTALSALALPFHVSRGLAGEWLGRGARRRDPAVAVAPPLESLDQVRLVAAVRLPGARVRRRLYWRFTLEWRSIVSRSS
jgi:SAM-dependent methyltransferase